MGAEKDVLQFGGATVSSQGGRRVSQVVQCPCRGLWSDFLPCSPLCAPAPLLKLALLPFRAA